MTDIIIGGPVMRREWIIDDWYRHANTACAHAGLTPKYLHIIAPNDPTNDHLAPDAIVVHTDETANRTKRAWNHARYQHMTDLRNQGLAAVREHRPRWFLSLDSDILLHPLGIVSLINAIEEPALDRLRFDAVGGKCYMTDTRRYPSYGMLVSRTGGIRRQDVDDNALFPVDVIMAIKLMTPPTYDIDYQYHPHGEDIGWSNAVRAAGLRIGWDGRVENDHHYEQSKQRKRR